MQDISFGLIISEVEDERKADFTAVNRFLS